jgi:signal transduction histidine kinase
MPLHVERFKVKDLMLEIVQQVEPLKRDGMQLESDIPDSIGELRTDRQKLKQIVLNLLTNALKFTAHGSVTISVKTRGSTGETWISVRDTGIGIAPEDHEKIFEDFRQVDSSPAREYGGTGLGLSICRRLAKMLGGDIHLKSELGKGSTFTLVLPNKRGSRRR